MPEIKHPQPRRAKRSYASFLDDSSRTRASLDTRVSRWVESVESSQDERLARSDSGLDCSQPANDDLVQERPRSAPEMGQSENSQASMVPPPTPSFTSAGRRTQPVSQGRTTTSSSFGPRDKDYRDFNLELNQISIESAPIKLPEDIQGHLAEITDRNRDSPEISEEDLATYLDDRRTLGAQCYEDKVTKLVQDWVLPDGKRRSFKQSGLQCDTGILMSSHLTPAHPAAPANVRVSQPKPDIIYGYKGKKNATPFTESQRLAQNELDHYPGQAFARANGYGLRFPFLVMELKADGGSGGSLYVAENQCAGDSAACLNAAERLNELLRETKHPMIDNLTYSVAVDNRLAQLYVSWMPERLTYYMYEIRCYVLSRPDEFKEFRRHIRNIIDWGKDKRFKQIQKALDTILEENHKKAAEAAKARGLLAA